MNPQIPNQTRLWRTLAMVTLGLTAAPSAWSQDTAADEKDVFELSPFEVDASNDMGYYSERTLAGSRIDTKLSDLAASISVINREQLEDTAAVDTNDVFMYELNTEGLQTYTPSFNGARGGLRDFSAGHSHTDGGFNNNQTANRIRGIGAANFSQNYYITIPQIGWDTYNTRSVEVNRGPNSLLFGQGSPAGIVNQNTATAYTDIKQTEIQIRIDDKGSFRGSFNHNQPIIEDKLGIYVAAVYDDKAFERKPSYDETTRIYGAVTYTPIKKLRIRGNYEYFTREDSRPNSLTPYDAVTPWLDAGRPAYDPLTRYVSFLDGGEWKGPYVQSDLSPGYNPNYQIGDGGLSNVTISGGANAGQPNQGYIPGMSFWDRLSQARQILWVYDEDNYYGSQLRPDGVGSATTPWVNFNDPAPSAANRTPEQHMMYDRMHARTTWAEDPGTMANWTAPGITDKSIYDWTRYNTNTPNDGTMDADTANLEADYEILPNWFIQVGWFLQELDSVENYVVGQLARNTLFIDPNLNLPNGESNPGFGLPFVYDSQPDSFVHDITNEHFRAQTAYVLDFTDNDGWSHWLGKHNFIAIAQKQTYETGQIRTRASHVGGFPGFLPNYDLSTTDNYRYWANGDSRIHRHYYMGSQDGNYNGAVTKSAPSFGQPSFGGPSEAVFDYYNWAQGQWTKVDVVMANADSEATTYRSERITESYIGAWNASIWEDRFVPTVSIRHDIIKNRQTVGTANLPIPPEFQDITPPISSGDARRYTDKGYPIIDLLFNNWGDQQEESGDTYTYGATFDLLRWGQGNELTIFYNESENFNPPPSAQVDFFGNVLPRSGGEGKDYGFSFGLWNNKLVTRVTWFNTKNVAERTSAAGFAISRSQMMDTTFLNEWAEWIVRIQDGQKAALEDPLQDPFTTMPLTGAQEARISDLMDQDINYFADKSVGGTQTAESEGIEIGITYNPTSNWTMRVAISSQEAAYSVVAPEVDAWLAERQPQWESFRSPLPAADNTFLYNGVRAVNLTNFWTGYGWDGNFNTADGNAVDTPQDWFNLNVMDTQVNVYKAQEGAASPTLRKWRGSLITRYNFTDGLLENSFIGGGLRYEDKAAIGYYGASTDPTRPGYLNVPDVSRPIYDSEQWYFDFMCGYRMKIFDDKADLLLQLNIRNVFESGELRPIGVNYDGTPHTYRIIDPREFYLTATIKF